MLSEDEDRRSPKTQQNLDEMSIEALETYIAELEREIERARTTIAFKRETRNSATALFNRGE